MEHQQQPSASPSSVSSSSQKAHIHPERRANMAAASSIVSPVSSSASVSSSPQAVIHPERLANIIAVSSAA